MILARDVPLVALKTAVYDCISEKQSMDVHGVVPPKAKLPYMTIDDVIAKPDDTKLDVIWNVTVTINVLANEEQQKLVNEALNDITTIIAYYGPTLDVGSAYKVIDCNIGLVETFSEQTTGFHGLMQLEFLLGRKS